MGVFQEVEIEYSVHPPSLFVQTSWQRLLPGWTTPVLSTLIVLQRSPMLLSESTPAVERCKQTLRDRSISLVKPLLQSLTVYQYEAELFDPRTGLPYCATRSATRSGIPLNDVAVVHASLGYELKQYGQCHCILHPIWGSSVYPAIVLASATPLILSRLVADILG